MWHFFEFDSLQKRVGEQLLHLLGTLDLVGAVPDHNNVVQIVSIELLREFKESLLLPHQHLLGELGLELVPRGDDFHLGQQFDALRQPFVRGVIHPVRHCIGDQDNFAVF